ncbi:PEST proteolytic signal-containing nuclear protein isoform 1-T1 [Salvelinus alpinus]|uniref:PEST proteolytic signal-containing nuclear protein n=1 Tax=Salvelinus namaycush TaxID=8040 RepID=A0A8U0QCN8_SALNM|nr:PEST proteolytic signal-containing nuclear protein-like isoform X1 [Salvelinus namaycush]XP_038839542.1 PEST proteolytic signal-containing nuclear protein-like isoform X1 [Salvelinus namaycush]XP_055786250.1 PEST proteolytic signal-containing nuclear protein-like isoform X1 [Salvelinus fontinalis]
MADYNKHSSKRLSDDGAGPEEKEASVKTKTVSSSTGGGGKRSAQEVSPGPGKESTSSHPVPPAPKVSKIGFGLISQPIKKPAPISIKLGASKPKEPVPVPAKKPALASVFNVDSDDSEEEMPAEAKMRMKNIGRETPTSAGPNSFNKGKQGFSDHQKLWERKLKSQTDTDQ